MDMVEPLWRDGERLQGGLDVAVHLGVLAVEAGLGPCPDLLGQAMPHELGGDQPDRGVGACVGEAVDCVEHLASEGGRD